MIETCLSVTWLFHFQENVLWTVENILFTGERVLHTNSKPHLNCQTWWTLPQGLDTITEGKINYKVYQDFFFPFLQGLEKLSDDIKQRLESHNGINND